MSAGLGCDNPPSNTESDIPAETEGAAGNAAAPSDEIRFDLGRTFVDADGRNWLQTRRVEYSNEAPSARIDEVGGPSLDQQIVDMPVTRAMPLVSPALEIGGYEYQLTENDAKLYAFELQARMKMQIASGVPDGAGSKGAEDTDREQWAVFGADNRVNKNSVAHQNPYVMIAKLDNNGGDCTGFKLINEHTAVTSAHCVHNGTAWLSRHTIMFGAGSGNTASGGTGSPQALLSTACYGRVVPGGWDGSNTDFDYAVLYLHGRNGAYCNTADYDVGYFGYQGVADGDTGIDIRLGGYANPPPSGADPMLFYHAGTDTGFQPLEAPNLIFYTNDSSGAQSGAPAYIFWSAGSDYRIKAVHKGGPVPGMNVNAGPRVNWTMINFFTAYAGF